MAETIDLTIDDITTTAFVKLPAGAGPFPGVVVTYHRGGMDEFTEWLVDDLAAKGYGAIAPNHYHALPEGSDVEDRKLHLTDEQMARDLEVSAAWLADIAPPFDCIIWMGTLRPRPASSSASCRK